MSGYDYDRQRFLEFLDRTGHFDNPAHGEAYDVAKDRRTTLEKSDSAYVDAVKSYQESDANVANLVRLMHGRELVVDGDAGDATIATANLPRCGVPEFSRDRQEGNAGQGWPLSGCDPNDDGNQRASIRIGIDTRGAPDHWLQDLPFCVETCERMALEMNIAATYTVVAEELNPRDFEMRITIGGISGPTIGWNYLPQPNTCGQSITGKLDSNYRAGRESKATLCAHEHIGHGCGSDHTNGGVMNPSLLDVPLTFIGDPAEPWYRRVYGIPETPTVPAYYTGKILTTPGTILEIKDGRIVSATSGTTPPPAPGGGGWFPARY